jgi:hypothetical protein
MKYILSLALFFSILDSHAQVRHVKGIKSLEAGGGITKYGTSIYLAYLNYFSGKVYGKYNVFYEGGRRGSLKYLSTGLDVSACYSLKPVKEFFYFNLRAGATASSDKLKPAITVYDEKGNPRKEDYSILKFGVFGGFETETFLTDRFVLVVGANQRMMFKPEFGKNRFFVTGGIRYNL